MSSRIPSLSKCSSQLSVLRSLGSAVGLASCLLFTPTASASPDYPEIVQRELEMPCVPQCTLCHTSNPGQAGTARQSFKDDAEIHLGMRPDLLPEKLEALETAHPDLVAQLTEGINPNSSGEESICELEITYGCAARVEPKSPLAPWSTAVGAFALLACGWVVRRRALRG